MHVPLTLAALALLTAVMVLLRIYWSHLTPRIHHILLAGAGAAIAIQVLGRATHLQPSSQFFDASLNWFSFAGYEFLILLLTLFRPRLVTSVIAAVLILPILSASTLLPLSAIFDRMPQTTTPLGGNLFSVRTIVNRSSVGTSAADLEVFYRTPWLPFLQHRIVSTRFFNTQCDTAAAFATLQSEQKTVVLTCPAVPAQPPGTAVIERHPIH